MDRQKLISMSQDEYRSLDIAQFILSNIGRYASSVVEALKKSFDNVDYDEVCNSIFAASCERLKSIHARNMDAVGEARAIALFTPLKMIATRDVPREYKRMFGVGVEERVSDAVYRMVRHHNRDSRAEGRFFDDHSEWTCYMLAAAATDDHTERHIEADPWESATDAKESVRHRSALVESLRHKLPRTEYQVLRLLVCDELSHPQIGPKLSISDNNVCVVRHNLRKRLSSFLPPSADPQETISAA